MRRLIEEPVNSEHYEADACIVWCFDARFSNLLTAFLKHEEMAHVDIVKVAGGAKALASPASAGRKLHRSMEFATSGEREHLLGQIAASIRLHKTPLIVLMAHAGCDAYVRKFENAEAEHAFYAAELAKAREVVEKFLQANGTPAKILALYADWEGLTEL